MGVANPVIDYADECGNTLAAVAPFALLRGLINPTEGITKNHIYNTTTQKIVCAELEVKNCQIHSEWNFITNGRPGNGSKILSDFIGSGRSFTSKLLSTGEVREEIKLPEVSTPEDFMVNTAIHLFSFTRPT